MIGERKDLCQEKETRWERMGKESGERGWIVRLTSRNSLALLHASSSNLIASPSSSGSVA